MKIIDWKEEAQKHASVAGTLKMQLAARLDNLTSRLIVLRGEAASENDTNMLCCIMNKISIYEEEKRWIQSLLRKSGDENG